MSNYKLLKKDKWGKVYRLGNGWIIKKSVSIDFVLTEWIMFQKMAKSGYVPKCIFRNTWLAIEDLGDQVKSWKSVTNKDEFLSHYDKILEALKEAGKRHGDLTKWAIIVKNNKPYLIDFAESKMINDPRMDKRPEGDSVLLRRAMDWIADA